MREEEKKRSSQPSKMKAIMKKRWFLPALYITSAALLLTGILWYQASDSEFTKDTTDKGKITSENNEPSIEVNNSLETFAIPVTEADSAVIKKEFYDVNGDTKQQEASLVFYNNTYQPNTGVDYGMKDSKGFDVAASMSGKVTSVQEDALLGNVVVIEHGKGLETHYSSVKDIRVQVGDSIKQGEVLASAGKSTINEEAGTHVHFEMRKDNVAVNPLEYLQKPLNALKVDNKTDNKTAKEEKTN